jgi:MFS family permease
VLTLGLSSYVPLFSQQVLGTGAVVAGLALAAMTIGWPIAATTAGRLYLRFGFRVTLMTGAVIALIGALLLLTVDSDSSVARLALACFVMGLGMGYVASPSIVAAQTAVSWSRRGVATGANMFARSFGSAVGVALFGAVVNSMVSSSLGTAHPHLDNVSGGVLEPAIHAVFVLTVVTTALLLVVAAAMPARVSEPDAVELTPDAEAPTPAS